MIVIARTAETAVAIHLMDCFVGPPERAFSQ